MTNSMELLVDFFSGLISDVLVVVVSVGISTLIVQRSQKKDAYNSLHDQLYAYITDLEYFVSQRWKSPDCFSAEQIFNFECEIGRVLTNINKKLGDISSLSKAEISHELRRTKYIKLRQAATLDRNYTYAQRRSTTQEFSDLFLKEFPKRK